METKDIIYKLRTEKGLSQEELAEKVFCDPSGGLPLGDGRNGAEYRDAEAAFAGA